jgi:AcrR family transcriptional regulator
MSTALGVSTGAFYWLFKNLGQLHDELRTDWAETNTKPLLAAQIAAAPDAIKQYKEVTKVFVLEEAYDPNYDNAIREWSRTSAATAEVLLEIDLKRIAMYREIFEAMDYSGEAAEIRARVCYYHQVGYQAMRVEESTESRLSNMPFYNEILTGISEGS